MHALPQIIIIVGLIVIVAGVLEGLMYQDAMWFTVGIVGGCAVCALGVHLAH